jgi:hypothetical protein
MVNPLNQKPPSNQPYECGITDDPRKPKKRRNKGKIQREIERFSDDQEPYGEPRKQKG